MTPDDLLMRQRMRSQIEILTKSLDELVAENRKLARALAAEPTPIEERKVVALERIAENLHPIRQSLSDGGGVFSMLWGIHKILNSRAKSDR